MPEATDILSALEGALDGFHSPLEWDLFIAHSRQLAGLYADVLGKPADPAMQARLEKAMVATAKLEPVWGLLAGVTLWRSGRRLPHDFQNIWTCARYAGIQSRFSAYTAQQHLQMLDAVSWPAGHVAPLIIRGNALRSLHRYSQAEDAYLEGLSVCPDNPFLKFRLVDLWLMTHQHHRACELLASLRARYPRALEHLFALPIPDAVQPPQHTFTELDAIGADIIWWVAADPVYIQRFGLRLAQGIARAGHGIKLHLHAVGETDTALPMDVLQAMAQLVPLHVTHRQVNLQGTNANQKKALFASERFIFLHEILHKYNLPVLVTDIDVDPLKHPAGLFAQMGDGDVGHTRFGVIRDAWDRYPATALWFKPTEAAKAFCQRLSVTILSLLSQHPEPWFVDQVALFRLIEGGLTPAKTTEQPLVLTDTDSPEAFFRILHGSWQ